MSSISNRFFVTALDDGTTLHGNLASDKSLSQAWTGSSAVPDWTVNANRPTIYLTLLSGTSLVVPQSTYQWMYEGQVITFNEETGISTSPSGLFMKTTKAVTYGGQTLNMPALKIMGNLASSDNVNVDMITFKGSCSIGGSAVPFECAAQIRITEIQGNGFLGIINFVNGVSDITEKGQVITMYGKLYDSNGGDVECTTQWYLNDASTGTSGQNKTIDGNTYANAFQVSEGSVVDHATVKCVFTSGGQTRYTAYAGIDDMQDPEFLYIQYNGANGNAASLRKDESVTFSIWVGLREDAAVLGGTSHPTYNSIKVKLLDGNANEITASGLPDIPDRGSDGMRPLSMSGGKGTLKINFATVNDYGKNITGIVIAYTS